MDQGLEKAVLGTSESSLARLALGLSPAGAASAKAQRVSCFHCGEPCRNEGYTKAEKAFCCQGCLLVHDLLGEKGLDQFYALSPHPGARIGAARRPEKWSYLDEGELQRKLLDFRDEKVSRITLHIPAIHCVACVWLLENLFRLHQGIGKTQVNFPRKEVSVAFMPGEIKLSELVALLASIGYEPQLTLNELTRARKEPWRQRQWLQVGVAGFAFGNIMLFTLPGYLGLDSLSGPLFRALFGYLSLALALPVLTYSAADYWRSAWLSVRQRVLTLDVPITLGMAALYGQSAFEILSGRGEGYLDSLAGLVFLLLCGRVFQQKTQERIVFDRDYRSFFPLAVTRKTELGEEGVAISSLRVGDRLLLRNREIIPADSRLVSNRASIDYSFVTGEAEPVSRQAGEYLYAGGQQVGAAIEVEIVKPVSQSYLTSLWSHETFQKARTDHLDTVTNRYSRRFTRIVVLVAMGSGIAWYIHGEPARGLKAFASVLIVACPCALALAAPFTLGTAQRLLARIQIFLKNALVLERLAQVDSIVFDKTGTLTSPADDRVAFWGSQQSEQPGQGQTGTAQAAQSGFARVPEPDGCALEPAAADLVYALARQSLHPHALKISDHLANKANPRKFPSARQPEQAQRAADAVELFSELPGCGITGRVNGHEVRLGSRAWLINSGVLVPELPGFTGSISCLAIEGQFRGVFVFTSGIRPETECLLQTLSRSHELTLLSGDNEREQARFEKLFGSNRRLHFNQTPTDKLGFVKALQQNGRRVMMVGDGLNDAGALKQSDVGVAVVERTGAFSPASDLILEAGQVPHLANILTLARNSVRIVHFSFGISALYNLVGIGIASAGVLSPLLCAILMPVSSVTVVLFACTATAFAARRAGLSTPVRGASA